MQIDPRNVIVTESGCNSCGVGTIQVHHGNFPELRIEGRTAEEAARRLAARLETALDVVADPAHREPVRQAVADIQAFLSREGSPHPAREM